MSKDGVIGIVIFLVVMIWSGFEFQAAGGFAAYKESIGLTK